MQGTLFSPDTPLKMLKGNPFLPSTLANSISKYFPAVKKYPEEICCRLHVFFTLVQQSGERFNHSGDVNQADKLET